MSELFTVLLLIAWMLVVGLSFHLTSHRPEYRKLIQSGQPINLNLFSLTAAWRRKEDDPLKPAHKRIALIGILHFAILIVGILLLPLVLLLLGL